jgi:Domain of Unknown Function with PDB structure (DUF3857)
VKSKKYCSSLLTFDFSLFTYTPERVMKKLIAYLLLLALFTSHAYSQQRISKKEIDLLQRNLKENPLLSDKDADFTERTTAQWPNESAVIISQKTSFDFDKKGLSAGKRIGRNVWGIIFAVPTLGTSLIWANMNNETKILIEETERRRILLRDKFALEQYSVLYFRLSTEGDAFAARVIKKDGSTQPVDISEAIKVEDIRSVPSVFRSYTDERFTAAYRPDFFKIAVPDLEEGDVIEYEFKNFNNQRYYNNPNYKEFDPVYYLCNRDMPVGKQVIEVATQDDKYYIGYKSLKGAPDFAQAGTSGKKVYRWEDKNRDKMVDTRYVNEFMEMPSVKFQVIYARNNSRNFVWFKDEAAMKQDISNEDIADKAKTFWFQPEKLHSTGDYTAGLTSGIDTKTKELYRSLKKKGITEASDDDYVRKAYYMIRSQTLYSNWSDYAFAKIFSGLLNYKKLKHEIVVTSSNTRTNLNKIAFTQELAWVIRYKDQYFSNPNEHLNPGEVPEYLTGNTAIRFSSSDMKASVAQDVLPLSDTLENVLLTQVKAALDPTGLTNMNIEKTVEARGLVKDDIIDEILALTPFMEADYRNYDGMSMWEGLSSKQEEKAMTDFTAQKKEWKEEKPKMMEAMAESQYGFEVEKYGTFRLQQDGRSHKKRSLKYNESFTLAEMTAAAGQDLILPISALMGEQPKIKQDERKRSLPVDLRYPRNLSWNIIFTLPAGYTAKGIENLNKQVSNACGSITSNARIDGNSLILDVKKIYKGKQFDPAQWQQLVEILDVAYDLSQTKVVLKKI